MGIAECLKECSDRLQSELHGHHFIAKLFQIGQTLGVVHGYRDLQRVRWFAVCGLRSAVYCLLSVVCCLLSGVSFQLSVSPGLPVRPHEDQPIGDEFGKIFS